MKNSIPWWKPRIGSKEKKLLAKVLADDFPNEGRFTALFEQEIARFLNVRHALAVTSGTAAIFLALKALGVGRDDEVIVPDLTFIATANAVELCGAKPVLVDIDPATLNMAPGNLERSITKRTKAVIPVHVSGRAADMDAIVRFAKKNRIYVVEDAAEAFMSKYKRRYLGTIGDAGCFSFSPHKTITTGQGGMVVTNDDKLYDCLRKLKDQGRPVRGTGGDDLHGTIGYNFKFTDLQAALGLGQLTYLRSRINKTKKIYLNYVKNLRGVKGISLLPFDIEGGAVPQWTDAIVERRDSLDGYLKSNRIDCRRFWFPLHTQAPYKLPDSRFPNSTRLSPKAIWLPSAFTMSDSDVGLVCSYIRKFFAAG